MSKATLVGRTIERPPAEVVQKRPEIEERRRVDITHIIAARSQLKEAIDELRDSDEINGAEGLAALADAEQELTALDEKLPKPIRAHADLADAIDSIEREFADRPGPRAAAERTVEIAHAFAQHIDDLDPEAHAETIERGNEFLKFVNPDYDPNEAKDL